MAGSSSKRITTAAALLAAIALAAGGTWLANQHIETKVAEKTQHLQALYDGKLTTVVVPTTHLARGQRLEQQFLATRDVPTEWVQSGAITAADYKGALGRVLEFDADGGKPLLWAQLEGHNVPTFSGRVADGQRAVTIPVDTISSFSGFLEPDDRIDLILTYKHWRTEKSRPLLQNVLVLASGTRVEVDSTSNGGASRQVSTVTLLVTPEDAERIIHAQTVGKITATLRHPKDGLPVANRGTTAADLFKDPVPTRSSRVSNPRPGIELIVGGSVGSTKL
ncbi:Flp pilus assembly protein CpaB [Allohahella sp. A8]|uniref:Flp pilus assembly protein CpaB n=1 Tax=Allohahella sp. A8 TaxID=3141461 RepID=UPI003A7F74D1